LTVNDDILHINTQSSSQWDGLRHFAYQDHKTFYNGLKEEEITGADKTMRIGVQAWSKAGIVSRGVLLDFHAYAQKHGITYEDSVNSGVTLEQLEQVRKEQGTEIKQGDIVLIRFGFIFNYTRLTDEQQKSLSVPPHVWVGVAPSEEFLAWVWNNRLAAVGGDAPAFESQPPGANGLPLHPILLGGFGCPIGELFDLERLSEECMKAKRWSFFFTSAPLNVPGGVASPPNAIAIL